MERSGAEWRLEIEESAQLDVPASDPLHAL